MNTQNINTQHIQMRHANTRHMDIREAIDLARKISEQVDGVIAGKKSVVELTINALLAGGHVLLEDVPGVGKTTLAHALGACIGGETGRIQFTADMLPSDITGVSIYNQSTHDFSFHPGPLFANVVIADEINRANPKTQSAMLEAMGEGTVSIDGVTRKLPQPFFVIATQNPIEMDGTYPLPEAQIDRFMVRTSLGYPDAQASKRMLTERLHADPLAQVSPVTDVRGLMECIEVIKHVTVAEAIIEYIVLIVEATRTHGQVRYGASPRASLHLLAMARARAIMHERNYVTPQDVQAIASDVLAHRLVLTNRSADARSVMTHIIASTPAPQPTTPHVSNASGANNL